jgi:hypothetical protein
VNGIAGLSDGLGQPAAGRAVDFTAVVERIVGCSRTTAWDLVWVASNRAEVAAKTMDTRLAPNGDGGGGWLLAPDAMVYLRRPPKVPIDYTRSISDGWGNANSRREGVGGGGTAFTLRRGVGYVTWRSARVGLSFTQGDVEQTRVSVRVHVRTNLMRILSTSTTQQPVNSFSASMASLHLLGTILGS